MKKLTATQQKCIDQMKKDIDRARSMSLQDYIVDDNSYLAGMDEPYAYLEEHWSEYEWYTKYYNNYKNGIVLVCGFGKPTLEALQRMGLITVIEYEKYRNSGVIDWAKLNNY